MQRLLGNILRKMHTRGGHRNAGHPDTFNPTSKHVTCTFQTPSIHNLDNIQTLPNILWGQMGQNRSNLDLPDTFQTPSIHPPGPLSQN